MGTPDWANDDIAAAGGREVLDELAREDQWMRSIESGETPKVAAGSLGETATTAQVAAFLHRSPKTIRRYIAEGKLKAKGDKHSPYVIERAEFERFIQQTATATPLPSGRSRRPAARRQPSPKRTFRDRVKDGR